jgi:ferredoxin-type protein NapF
MKTSALKHIRIIFSALLLLAFFLMFVDFRGLVPEKASRWLLYLQFVPSFIKYTFAGVATAVGFIIVIALTILTGRTYCSFLCPLGVLQDVNSRLGGRIKRRYRKYGYKKPYTITRYLILAVVSGVVLLGGTYVLNMLDPYSIFGRFMTYFAKPVVLSINNFAANILGRFDIYTIYKVDIKFFDLAVYAVPVVFVLLVGVLSIRYGRLYCNSVCPVGTLLGLISKISILRIRFEKDSTCTRCGRCAVACKSSCIDFLNRKIDLSRCVNCFNCIDACSSDGISYSPFFIKRKEKPEKEEPVDDSRRKFIAGTALLIAGLPTVLKGQDIVTTRVKDSGVREDRLYPVCPPGSVSIANFTSRCTACSLCISVCPTSVIQPSLDEYGISGIMQPRMNFEKGFCNYECTKCSQICPTGAIMPLKPEAKKLTQIGKAVYIRDNCYVYTERTACGACSEHCPTKAVSMIPFEDGLYIPETHDNICIGCGACEYACPATPYKAIFVDGNPVHEAAQKPETSEMKNESNDFPF